MAIEYESPQETLERDRFNAQWNAMVTALTPLIGNSDKFHELTRLAHMVSEGDLTLTDRHKPEIMQYFDNA